jgi:iron complex transport system permease protein
MPENRRRAVRGAFAFPVLVLLLAALVLFSARTGSIDVSFGRLLHGLFTAYDRDVAIIFDLRFPRIFVALLGGAAMAVSGVLLQAVMKNPLADPTIIGVSGGAAFAAVVTVAFAPALFFFVPLLSFAGGLGAFFIVYALSWRSGLSPVRIILVGVAVGALFTGLTEALGAMTGSTFTGVASIVNANIAMKTWEDVRMLLGYVAVGLLAALALAGRCNLIQLEDRTVRSLGIAIGRTRLLISVFAVLLASIAASVVGTIAFLGLIAPHIGRLLVGSDHRALIPFAMPLGAFLLLGADTVGRLIAPPFEVSAQIVMSVVGGPFFVVLLLRSGRAYGK